MKSRNKLWAGLAVLAFVGFYVLTNLNTVLPYFMLPVRWLEHHDAGTIKTQEAPAAAASDADGLWWTRPHGASAPEGGPPANALAAEKMPAGALTIEAGSAGAAVRKPLKAADAGDWPHFNRTLTAERFSSLAQINRGNVSRLKEICSYDTKSYAAFQSGLLQVDGALFFTTVFDTVSIDAATCKENWRVHERYAPASPQGGQRGPAYGDGRIYRGTSDARVLAYDAKTGKPLWEQTIGDPKKGEVAIAAPIAWQGMVFIGIGGGDFKGVKGRMYGLDGATGKILWEFYMVPQSPSDPVRGPSVPNQVDASTWGNAPDVPITGGGTWTAYTIDPSSGLLYVPGGNPAPDLVPSLRPGSNLYADSLVVLDAKTGAYRSHINIVPKDWHDWDVSAPPALVRSAAGRELILLAPKDGHLYGFDLKTHERRYRTPATRIENADVEFEVGKPQHFCPGVSGGAEWNGPSYNPENNLVVIGETDWCSTVTRQADDKVKRWPDALPWFGNAFVNPMNMMGKFETADWGGWVYAIDADSGQWKWRAKTNYPIWAATLPTAGGLVFFGDLGGNFYALDADTGAKLYAAKLKGALAGGVISYLSGGRQRIAATAGFTQIVIPSEVATAKVVVMGLD